MRRFPSSLKVEHIQQQMGIGMKYDKIDNYLLVNIRINKSMYINKWLYIYSYIRVTVNKFKYSSVCQ